MLTTTQQQRPTRQVHESELESPLFPPFYLRTQQSLANNPQHQSVKMHICPRRNRGPTIPKHVAMDFSNQIRQSGSWTALYKDWENKKLDLTIQDPSSRYETAASAEACRSLEPAAKRTSNPFQQPANQATYSNLFRKSKQTQTTNITKKGSKKRQGKHPFVLETI